MAKVHATEHSGETYLRYRCPGCKHDHSVPAQRWHWNGSVDTPTLHPSVRHFYTRPEGGEVTTCHYHIKEGKIEFCGDCPHWLKGQTVDLPDIDEPQVDSCN